MSVYPFTTWFCRKSVWLVRDLEMIRFFSLTFARLEDNIMVWCCSFFITRGISECDTYSEVDIDFFKFETKSIRETIHAVIEKNTIARPREATVADRILYWIRTPEDARIAARRVRFTFYRDSHRVPTREHFK